MQTKHTPTPWKAVKKNGDIHILGKRGMVVAVVPISYSKNDLEETAETEANAAVIVRAVNNHEALLNALKIEHARWTQPHSIEACTVCPVIRAAEREIK